MKTLAELTEEQTARTQELERLPAIASLAHARLAVERAQTFDEAKDLRDQAEALYVYSRRARLSHEVQVAVTEIRVRAERRCGQLLRETSREPGQRSRGATSDEALPPRLKDLGVSRSQSSRWQQVASIDDAVFEDHLARARDRGREVTTSSLLTVARRDQEVPSFPVAEPGNSPAAPPSLRVQVDGATVTVWADGRRDRAVTGELTPQRARALIDALQPLALAAA